VQLPEAARRALDRPVWASLERAHAALSIGDELARRYARDVNLFASARDDTPAALGALAALVRASERVFVLQVPGILVPGGLAVIKDARGVQMIATRSKPAQFSQSSSRRA
jgi:hypothetical protein